MWASEVIGVCPTNSWTTCDGLSGVFYSPHFFTGETRIHARIMEQVLLGMSPERAEMDGGKLNKPFRRDLPLSAKINVTQNF